MFSLSALPKLVKAKRKRLGRGEGSRTGKNAGRGHKGQAKHGGKMPVFFAAGSSDSGTSALSRNPKTKGFKARENKQISSMGLAVIMRNFGPSDLVSVKTMCEKNLISDKIKNVRIIMSKGITEKVTIKFDTNKNIHLTKGVLEALN